MYTSKAPAEWWDPLARIPDVRFAIVGNPRTGSSHLVSLLDSHPDVACWNYEIFEVGEAFDQSIYDDPRDFLRECVFRVNARAVGFKLLWNAMKRTVAIWDVLRDLDIWLVHTYRANVLDSFISLQLATINEAFTSHYGDYTTTQFVVDYDECLEWFEAAEKRDAEIRRRSFDEGIRRLEIEYKELCETQDRVLDFLGVPRHPLTSRLTKQRQGSQRDSIANYAEIKERFAGSRWSMHFEE